MTLASRDGDKCARVLVVDDSLAVARALRVSLGLDGHHVDGALTVSGGLKKLARCDYSLVILDLKFPKGSGLDVLQAVHNHWPELPVIMWTGNPSQDTAIKSLQLGAFDFVLKPDTEALRASVERGLKAGAERRAFSLARDVWTEFLHAPARPSALTKTLSKREAGVAELLAAGETVADISKAMGISAHTVRNHLRGIFKKLDVHSQAEFVSLWHRSAAGP